MRYFALKEYVCQMLNLFEMAVSFRLERILPADVFCSWVPWIFELCSQEKFDSLWPEIKSNYVASLRRVIEIGIQIWRTSKYRERSYEDPLEAFFDFLADEFQCEVTRSYVKVVK